MASRIAPSAQGQLIRPAGKLPAQSVCSAYYGQFPALDALSRWFSGTLCEAHFDISMNLHLSN